MYIILIKYIKPLVEVDQCIPPHLEFLDAQYQKGVFIASGARVPRTGGVILAVGNNRATIDDILKQDPFYIAKVAEYEVIEFSPSKMKQGFEQFLSIPQGQAKTH